MSVVAKAVAEEEFKRLLEHWEIEAPTEDDGAFDALKTRIVSEICKGRLSITDDGLVKYSLVKPIGDTTELELNPDKMRMHYADQFKDHQQVQKLMAIIGSMCGVPPRLLNNTGLIDGKVLRALGALFLAQ